MSADLSPLSLAPAVRSGQVDPVTTIESVLDNITSASYLNAFISIDSKGALETAAKIRAEVAHGRPVGRLAGVPFSVKDVISVTGMPTTAGSRSLLGSMPQRTASAVERLQAAGAICIGKTNTPEFAHWMHTDNETFGATRSPIDGYSPGGSSGADAAAVAAGLVGFGIGTDFGGSLRWPGHCTGTCAVRPTVGRVPITGFVPGLHVGEHTLPAETSLLRRLAVIGPIAQNVKDLRALLAAMSGPDNIDELCVSSLPVDDPTSIDGLEGSWWPDDGEVRAEQDIVDALEQAMKRLQKHTNVERRDLAPLHEACSLFDSLRSEERFVEIRKLREEGGQIDSRTDRALNAVTKYFDPLEHETLWARRAALRHRLLTQMRDFLILPVAPVTAMRIGSTTASSRGLQLFEWDVMRYVRAISLFGFPSVAVPIGVTSNGLPIGVQVVARPFYENVAFAVAERIATPC